MAADAGYSIGEQQAACEAKDIKVTVPAEPEKDKQPITGVLSKIAILLRE